MVTDRPILGDVAAVLPHTIDLTLAAMLVGLAVGVPVGVAAARHRNGWIDVAARLLSLVGLSFPVFVSGIFMLLAFALHWRIFPVIGSADLSDPADRLLKLVLPALTLGLVMAAYITRVTRSAMLQVLESDYVRTARAKGVPARRIVWRHALRNAAMPVVAIAAVQLGFMLGGSIVIEAVFALHGVGYLAWESISMNDFPVFQAVVLFLAIVYIGLTLAADMMNAVLDPRLRSA